jgi:hypothetical protein
MLLVLDDGMPQNLELNPIIFGKHTDSHAFFDESDRYDC